VSISHQGVFNQSLTGPSLSYFFKSKELPIRLSFFWGSYIITQIFSAFLALGLLRLRGHHGWEGWRWLFALEGILTALIGIASW
jgi:hypothetical protein